MIHFVYIIFSESHNLYYKGYSLHPEERLIAHNNNESRYTMGKGPWNLVFKQSFLTKREALIREKKLKKYGQEQIKQLVQSKKNEL